MIISDKWLEYELLDACNGMKLERWGDIIMSRPEPQAIWTNSFAPQKWSTAHCVYHRSKTGGGYWEYIKKVPQKWQICYGDMKFNIKPLGFKHTGLFPEQAANWDFIKEKIKNANRDIRVLNLFGYTGGATVAATIAGATEVVHVDASKGMVSWCKDNVILSNCGKNFIRYMVDDVVKFVARESRRGRKYDAIIMDPPAYGRGPNGELWEIENELSGLISACIDILSDNPLFFIINSYANSLSPTIISNCLTLSIKQKFGGKVTTDEIGLPISGSDIVLPCGITGRWECVD